MGQSKLQGLPLSWRGRCSHGEQAQCCRLSFPAAGQHCPAGTECRNERNVQLPVLWEILEPLFSVWGRSGSSLVVLILLFSRRPESCFFQSCRLGAGPSWLPEGILFLSSPLPRRPQWCLGRPHFLSFGMVVTSSQHCHHTLPTRCLPGLTDVESKQGKWEPH